MSRYIDATELNGYRCGFVRTTAPDAYKWELVKTSYASMINNAPTSDVIPVEWIEKYIEDNIHSGEIELMLDMWRKDHE